MKIYNTVMSLDFKTCRFTFFTREAEGRREEEKEREMERERQRQTVRQRGR